MSGSNSSRRLSAADLQRAPIIGMRTPDRTFHVEIVGRTNGDGFVLDNLRVEGLTLMEFREIMRALSGLTLPPQTTQPSPSQEGGQA